MNTTTPKHTATYSFTTCKRCGYMVAMDEELCKACQNQNSQGQTLFNN